METTLAHPPRVRLRSVLPRPLSLCSWTDFPVMHDTRGNLSFIEGGRHIPFDVERVYYLYDIPSLAERAGHAHRQLSQVFIALSGSFDLHLDDGVEKRTVHLCRANRGYITGPWVWRTLDNFSGNSVCLVLASHTYDESDYIREYADFRQQSRHRLGLRP